MPGYEKWRFVGLSQLESDEFSCGICLQILSSPAVVPCCRQTYCYGCIREWLDTSNSCPNDRTRLIPNQLLDPQRLVLNLLAKLTIRCTFCPTVSHLDSLQAHEDSCQSNPNRRCADCDVKMSEQSIHNCVNSLKLLNKTLAEEMSELKYEIEKLRKEIKSLKEKNETNNEFDHISEVMASARTRISYPEITYCSIPASLRVRAINKSKEAILAFDSYSQITQFLNSEFNCHQNSQNNDNKNNKWYTVVHSLQCGESHVANQNGYIDLRFGQLRIAIFSAGALLSSSLKTTSIIVNSSAHNI